MATKNNATKTATAIDFDTVAKSADMQVVKVSELYKKDADIVKALQSISVTGMAFYRLVHVAACSVLRRVGETGDVRIVNALFRVLPEGSRSNSLRDWLTAYGPIKFVQNKPVHVKDKEVELTKAIMDPFWKFSPEAAYSPVDVMKLIMATIKRLETDEVKAHTDHTAVIAGLKALQVPVPVKV